MRTNSQWSVLFIITFCIVFLQSVTAQSTEQRFTREKAIEFLQMHTGISAEKFDPGSFKFYSSATISDQKVSGIYISTKALENGNIYEFFLRTDKIMPAGPYTAYYLAGCIGTRPAGLSAFTLSGDECSCKTASDQNYLMKARDVNNIF